MNDESPSADRSKLYTAAEIAREFSLTAQGIRFYEEKGLVTPARAGKTRVFNYRDRARLLLVQKLRGLGFSIEAIREYLSLYKSDDTGAAQYRLGLKRIANRIRELEDKKRDIDEALAGLRALEDEARGRLERAIAAERGHGAKSASGRASHGPAARR